MSIAQKNYKGIIQRGIEFQKLQKFSEAEHCFQLVLRDNPKDAEVLYLLGMLAVETKRNNLSIRYLERAIKVERNNATLSFTIAGVLINAGNPRKAIPYLKKALLLDPGIVEGWFNLGIAQRRLGMSLEASKSLERALKLKPEFVNAQLLLGKCLADLGDEEAAKRLFVKVLQKNSADANAITSLANVKTNTLEDNVLGLVENVLSTDSLSTEDRVLVHYAGGKIYNDLNQYDNAFSHFNKAKALQVVSGTSNKKFIKFVEHCETHFTEEFFAKRKRFGNSSSRPVFIVGMPRSGTTLIEQILASHREITGAGELHDMGEIREKIATSSNGRKMSHFETIAALSKKDITRNGNEYLKTLNFYSKSALHVTDKMPHNFQSLGLISILFPHSHVIDCRRNPIDNCVSCYMTHFTEDHPYNNDLKLLGEYYSYYHRLMKHWNKVLPIPIHQVNYETLITSQEETTRKLIDFLGLKWDEACLDFHKTRRSVSTPSQRQIRKPIYTSSVGRWKRYETHLDPLINALGELTKL